MRRFVLLAVALALGGCETYREDHARIETAIASLIGKPIASAVSRLGVPSRTTPAGSHTIYVWDEGSVYYPGLETPLACEIRLMVDSADTITRGDHQGNNYACQTLASRL